VSQHFIVEAVLKQARSLPGYPRLRVADLSCGRGEILRALKDDGCDVVGTRFRMDDYEIESGRPSFLEPGDVVHSEVDLTRPLRYADHSFDVVILSEVVEHLPEWISVIHEAGRILDAGGHLILSTPNVQRLHSRWKFFWTGTHKLIRERVTWAVRSEALYAYHINPLDFPLAHTVLHQAGLHVQWLAFTRFKVEHAWLLLLYPVVWLATLAEIRGDEGERDLFRWMVDPAMLASEQLLIVARKGPASADRGAPARF
jgi:SAM-dependent methyltransferase